MLTNAIRKRVSFRSSVYFFGCMFKFLFLSMVVLFVFLLFCFFDLL